MEEIYWITRLDSINTFVFVSIGGSSLISALMMLSFFKSAELHKQSSKQWRDSE